jgi:YcxB-like protein
MTPSNTAQFTLTQDDWVRLQKMVRHRLFRRRGLRLKIISLQIFTGACIGLSISMYSGLVHCYPEFRGLQIVGCLLAAAGTVITAKPYLSSAIVRKHLLTPKGAFLCPQKVQFTDHGLVVDSAVAHTTIPWTSFLGREDDKINCYLFLDAMQALVLPLSAISPFRDQLDGRTAHLIGHAI